MLELVLGGARSGKSRYALTAAERLQRPLTLVVTAEPKDAEMAARIDLHRRERSPAIAVIEAPLQLAAAVAAVSDDSALVVDCLTLWLSNALAQASWEQERREFLAILRARSGPSWIVSNEVGSGIVPLGELSRVFVDEAGRLHQALAARAAKVTLMIAGLPVNVKDCANGNSHAE